MDITIIPMTSQSDIDGKGYVHYKSWHETYTGLIDRDYLEKFTLEKCVAMAHRYKDNILVAKDGDKVIGFVGYGDYRNATLPDTGEIFSIYVLQEYHGRKIGFNLMNEAFKHLTDYSQVAVWVLRGNDRAINFYKKYGFEFDGAEETLMLGTPNTELRMIFRKDRQN